MNASYLITFRDRDECRLPLLEAVISWLAGQPHLEAIIVEQDVAPRLDPARLPANVSARFVYNPGPFNKSWGLNVAATLASGELLLIGDADIIMPGEAISRALIACRDHFDAVNPYAHLVDLTESETRAFLEGGRELDGLPRDRLEDRRPQGEYVCFCGGICAFRRAVYFALGGMDERFEGWGGEDDAMSVALARHTERLAVQKDAVAWHLWHPRIPGRYHHGAYRHNRKLAEAYRSWSREELESQRGARQAAMGDPERYRSSP